MISSQGRSDVDDDESVRATRRALELGVGFFDTADVYGAGHSETVIGRALDGHRSRGHPLDQIRAHVRSWDKGGVGNCARLIAKSPGCTAIEHALNVLDDAPELIHLCEQSDLASINRSPLAMGLLSGKFSGRERLPPDDVRGAGHEWVPYFADGRPNSESLERLDAVRQILTSDGRTPAQGALAWIWARSERTIPIPGFKTVAQAEENARALDLGPLTQAQLSEIEGLLGRPGLDSGT
jgi:aryl-alcohol dehydrogenase-like predicted oxidoreductase